MIDLERIIFMAIKAGAVITIREDSVTILPNAPEQKPAEPKPAPADKPKESKAPKKTTRKELDMGKVKALRDAGWTFEKIADEMGCSPQTIVNRLKED